MEDAVRPACCFQILAPAPPAIITAQSVWLLQAAGLLPALAVSDDVLRLSFQNKSQQAAAVAIDAAAAAAAQQG